MPKFKPHILVIDDEASMLLTYKSILKHDYTPILVNSGEQGLEKLAKTAVPLVLLDMIMSGMDGLEVLKKIKAQNGDVEVVMVTAIKEVKKAVLAMKLGAYDYITKPFEMDELLSVVAKTLEHRNLIQENIYLRQKVWQCVDLIGKSSMMQQVFGLIDKYAPTDSTVLITGESGTGKELVAQAIHKKSGRADKPFVVINCAALPDNLIEAELFGYEKGAFTGAETQKIGKFELASTGTLFLDEIGCLKPNMQAKLLRVLQDNKVERLGGGVAIETDVRIIAATNLDLKKAIKENVFREDLFYRLDVLSVKLPPLRDRKDDIPLLLDSFLAHFNQELNKNIAGFSAEALQVLIGYDWPGNIRELQNLVEKLVVLGQDKIEIKAFDFSLTSNVVPQKLKNALAEYECRHIKAILATVKGNQTKAAQVLGIHRVTLISKMKVLGIKA